jgi:uncharacterized protein YaiE (UPF0345 family)
MAILLCGAGLFVARYQPLAPGSTGVGADPGGRNVTTSDPAGGQNGTVSRVTYDNGTIITFGFSLSNNGPVGVTVTGIYRSSPPSAEPLKVIAVYVAHRPGVIGAIRDLRQFEPFHSFALPGGAERLILVQARMVNCTDVPAGIAATYTQAPVSFRVLGVPRSTWVALPLPVEVLGTSNPCGSGA